MVISQGEIWWADLPAPVGRRPVLLLTRSAAYGYLNKAIVAEITTTIRGIPQEVSVGEPEGLVPSVVNFDNNQHGANENLRIRNLWEGIDSMAALLTMP